MRFAAGINIKLENLCFKGGAGARGGAVFVKEPPRTGTKTHPHEPHDDDESHDNVFDDSNDNDSNGGKRSRPEPGKAKGGGGNLEVVNCDFIHNTAGYGGAIYSGGADVNIDLSCFTGNLAAECGGALYAVVSRAREGERGREREGGGGVAETVTGELTSYRNANQQTRKPNKPTNPQTQQTQQTH